MGDKVLVMEKGIGSKKAEMRYTGKRKLIGIATMHKSTYVLCLQMMTMKPGQKSPNRNNTDER